MSMAKTILLALGVPIGIALAATLVVLGLRRIARQRSAERMPR
jgi:hypothetical protein